MQSPYEIAELLNEGFQERTSRSEKLQAKCALSTELETYVQGSYCLAGEVRHLLAAQRLQRGVCCIPRLVLYEAKAAHLDICQSDKQRKQRLAR